MPRCQTVIEKSFPLGKTAGLIVILRVSINAGLWRTTSERIAMQASGGFDGV
jgi:hypothetical protein